MEVKGRDLVAGVPKILEIKSDEVCEALSEPVNAVVEAAKIALERTPPELAADIVDKGIVLVGGGAQLRNLDVLLRRQLASPSCWQRIPSPLSRLEPDAHWTICRFFARLRFAPDVSGPTRVP